MQPGGVEVPVGDPVYSVDISIYGEIELGGDCDIEYSKKL